MSPLFHRAVVGRYELGSIVKTVTWALALEAGVARMGDAFAALEPLALGDHEIESDVRPGGVSFPAAFAVSSNRVAAELALRAGRARQERLFAALGLDAATPVEVGEARLGAPARKAHWGDVDTATAGYGHGVTMSPVHIAAAVATLVNGGERVRPTLLRREGAAVPGPRVVSAETSRRMRELMRLAVTDGTGGAADVAGLRVGGKTGTAEKPAPGGYDEDRALASFVAAFPIDRPKLVVMVMLDEPSVVVDGETRSWASLTAAPAAGRIIAAAAPLAGVAPRAERSLPAAPDRAPSVLPTALGLGPAALGLGAADPTAADPMTADPMTADPMTADPKTEEPMAEDPAQGDPDAALNAALLSLGLSADAR